MARRSLANKDRGARRKAEGFPHSAAAEPQEEDFYVYRNFLMDNISDKAAVTLYVVPGCPLCAGARAWLERHGIEYAERDVASDFGALRAMYRLTRQRFVPVFEVAGCALVRPTEDELARLLL